MDDTFDALPLVSHKIRIWRWIAEAVKTLCPWLGLLTAKASPQSRRLPAEDLQGWKGTQMIKINFLNIFRISVREATPEADLYNYDFKDKWEKSVEEGGLPKKYDQYDMNGYKKDHRVKNIKFTSKFDPSGSDDSAFGKKVFRSDADQKIFSVLDAKYDIVDKDWIDIRSNNYFSSEEYSAEDKQDTGNGRESTDEIKEEREDKNTKAWFVEF